MPLIVNLTQVKVSTEDIADLKRRLASARWPDQLENAGWNYGTEKSYLKARPPVHTYLLLIKPRQS
jgi:hypothetical protein